NAVGTAPQWMPALEAISIDSIEIVTTEGGIGGSDHTSFYLQEVPALHFFTGQHEHYHKPSDDPELVNYAGMVSVVRFISALIGELEDDGTLAWQETEQPDQMARDFKVTLGVMPDYLYTEEGMRIDGIREGRPAANGGLEKGDIVLRMGDFAVKDMQGYMEALNQFEPGQQITVVVKRGETVLEKQVTFTNPEG
ncbi:MAG: PDZ domain-containing protein, partial [Saprospiraceae bacterium]|nr:PDZ domain-containing protein [Saprospiraceae bacterium]